MKLAVVGAGVMGRNYLRAAKAANIPIAAVIDTDMARAQEAGAEYGLPAKNAIDPDIDAAVVVVPTAAHVSVAAPLLARGIPCLVEKPFAGSAAECRTLIDAAGKSGAVLQVGHIERFNPAAEALFAHKFDPAAISAITTKRMGPASARVTDISVVSDLMVHDLDIVLTLKPAAVTHVTASGTQDNATATLHFADGATATLTASRVSPERIRELIVTTPDTVVRMDYIAKTLETPRGAPAQTFAGDALAAELRDFIGAITHKTTPRVTGETALNVMTVAWRIEAALGLTA